MHIQVENLKSSEVKLTIELTEEELAPHKTEAAKHLQEQVNIQGFRKGHVPMEMLIKHIGEQAFMNHVLDHAIGASYEKALKEKEVSPVDYPKIQVLSQTPLKYEAIVPLMPEIEWKKDVSKLEIKADKLSIDKKEIAEVLKNIQGRFTKWKDVERAAKKGDRVEIDFDGFDEGGAPLDGTSSKNHPLILGQGAMIPGFEDEIEGMKKGEEKDFEITFPKDYHSKAFQSKKVKFHIKLHRVEEPEEPKLDDDFAKEVTAGNRKTLDELKKEVEEELMKQKERQELIKRENDFLKALKDYAKAEIPEALITRETDFMLGRIKQDWERKGNKWEDYLEQMKKEKKDLRKELSQAAEEQVLLRLALEKLYKEEKISVSEEDEEKEINFIMDHYPVQMRQGAREKYAKGQADRQYITQQIKLRKLVANHTKTAEKK